MNSRFRVLLHLVCIFVFLAAVLAEAPVTVVHAAATLTVTNAGDSGAGSLRDAIAAASPGDSIDFDGDYTITLASELAISQDLTITGAGHSVAIDGNAVTRVFNVTAGNVTFDHITIANGKVHILDCASDCNVGAGILIQSGSAVVTVSNSTLSGNWTGPGGGGGGIGNWATLIVADSTFSGNDAYMGSGGGIRNLGTLTVTDSTFSRNYGYSGAGISNAGTLMVADSTFSRNSGEHGGGIGNGLNGTLTITDSTFTGNIAPVGGGLYIFHSTATATNSTLYGNIGSTSGGIYSTDSTLTVSNSIIDNCSFYGSTIAGEHDIEAGTNSCGFGSDFSSGTDPLLGPLQDNGGPTMTMALLAGSPAIDAGDDAACAAFPVNNLDQRGVTRPQGAHCDIGAFEFEGPFLDTLAPAAEPVVSTAPNAAGWYSGDVTVTWNWADNDGGSGIDADNCTTSTMSSGEGLLTLTATCNDLAGNQGTGSYEVQVDQTAPAISAAPAASPNAAGWYNGNVPVHFTCSDALSGIPGGGCPADQALSTEGSRVSSTAQTVTDAAGNISATSNVVTVKIDKTTPKLKPSVGPNPVLLNGWAKASANALDALSGVASSSCAVLNTGAPGLHTVSCSATDKAGNTGTANASYAVIYNFAGFFSPVLNPPRLNAASAGRTLPLKFSLGGNLGLNILAAGSPASQPISCTTRLPIGSLVPTSPGGSGGLSYNSRTNTYSYDWNTVSGWRGTCRQFILTLKDGTLHFAFFQFR